MKKGKKLYTRRLSLDESREGYILVSKDALAMFPAAGKRFNAKVNGIDAEMQLDAVPCTCRGPDKPHEHYHLSFASVEPGIKARRGMVASIRKEEKGYNIRIR